MEVANPYSEFYQIDRSKTVFFFILLFGWDRIQSDWRIHVPKSQSRCHGWEDPPPLSLSIFGFSRRGKGTIRKKQGTQRAILFSYSVFPLPSPPFSLSFDF